MSEASPAADAAAAEEPVLAVEDLRTVFRTGKETVHAVDGVSLDICSGETVGLVGESGSGKSVTARSILGLVDAPGAIEGGRIEFQGTNLRATGWDDHRGDLAIVFQDPLNSLNPVYTVGNQLREVLRIHQDVRGEAARDQAIELLEDVGIPDAPRRLTEYPHQFSGGMQQRAVIALALACDPDLLVCDEPTTALDVTIQAQILDLLDDLQREKDLAILFITHDMGVIEETADRVNVIYAGEVVEHAPTEELFDNPNHPYTRALLESIPGRTASDEWLPTIEGEVPTPTEPAASCRFAPRCSSAGEACHTTHPESILVGDAARASVEDSDHTAACLLHDERHPSIQEASDAGDGEQTLKRSRKATTDREPFLETQDLEKYYSNDSPLAREPPVRAVDGVSFEIRTGETLGLVGESGCGKTTLGRTLAGLERATDGRIFADETDVTNLRGDDLQEWRREVGIVFQDPEESLNDRMTVGQIIGEPMEAHDWGTVEEREQRVFDLLDQVGLQEEHFYRYPHQFSGGQRQRVGIARALALEPDFLVLDEPVSALDVSVQARVINLLERLQVDLDVTFLFIAHDLSVVRHIADRVAVMYLGNVLEIGPTEQVFESPANPYTLSLLSAIPGSSSPAPDDLDRVTLRGSPPNPRYPPSGCPFATRCPTKIRPEGYDDLSAEAWAAIETFRNALRERARSDEPIGRTIKRRLGLASGAQSADEVAVDLFDGVSLPPDAADAVDEATRLAASSVDDAAAFLASEFDSPCDREPGDAHAVGDDRTSRCLRHREEYQEPDTELR